MNTSYDYSYQTREINTKRKVIYEKHTPEGCTIAYFYENPLGSQNDYQMTYNYKNNYQQNLANRTYTSVNAANRTYTSLNAANRTYTSHQQTTQKNYNTTQKKYKSLIRRRIRTPDNAGRFVARTVYKSQNFDNQQNYNQQNYKLYNQTYTRTLKRNTTADNHLLYHSNYTGQRRTYTPDTKIIKSSYKKTTKSRQQPIIRNVYTSTYTRRNLTPDNTNIYNATFTGFRRNNYNQLSKSYVVDDKFCKDVNTTYSLRRVNPNPEYNNSRSYQYKKVDKVVYKEQTNNNFEKVDNKKNVSVADENVQCCLDKYDEKQPQSNLKKYKVKVVRIKKKVVVDENEIKEVKVVRDAVISNKNPKLLTKSEYEKLKESNEDTDQATNKKNTFITTEKREKKVYKSSNKYGSDEKDSSNKKVLYNDEEKNEEENENEEDEDTFKKYKVHATKKTTTAMKSMKTNENDEEENENEEDENIENENENENIENENENIDNENENIDNENENEEIEIENDNEEVDNTKNKKNKKDAGYYKELVTQVADGAKGKLYKKHQVQKVHKAQKKKKSKDVNEENDGEDNAENEGRYYKKVVEKTMTQTIDSTGKKSKPKKTVKVSKVVKNKKTASKNQVKHEEEEDVENEDEE